MTYCARGRELLLDLKRSLWLPAYDDDGVRVVLAEIDELAGKIKTVWEEGEDLADDTKTTLAYYKACLERNIRYMDSYIEHRRTAIRKLRWETGMILSDSVRQEILSQQENEYFNAYSNLVVEYSQKVGLDLTYDLEPPKDLLIEISVLQDCGTIMTDRGPISLNKGSRNFLRRTEVEQLIREGMVKQVVNDDAV